MKKNKIAIIGLGYVGLPLAVAFSKKYTTIGYDINIKRVKEINSLNDSTLEITSSEIGEVLVKNFDSHTEGLFITNEKNYLKEANIFIITVPTPTDINNSPVLTPLIESSKTVGAFVKKDDIIIYESTVYPGVTEDECVPILEKVSGLKYNKDFYVGYSPERINPGDKNRTVTKILKVTSGSNKQTAKKVDDLYKSIITAGTFLAESIKVAEASKVIENSQRDINIAFVNELAKIFNILKIDTNSVLEAASTKWNFLPFKPGLVGGHCIGVDPYYLAQKAQQVGYNPGIILAGRRLNDSMGRYVSSEIIKLMVKKNILINDSNILILGITFKENCPDYRNTKVIDIINSLEEYSTNVDIYDPWVNKKDIQDEYSLKVYNSLPNKKYDAVVLAVSHSKFLKVNIKKLQKTKSVIYDVKGILKKYDARL